MGNEDEIEWCDDTTGTYWWPYEQKKAIFDALFTAANKSKPVLMMLAQVVSLFLPSGIKVVLMNADFEIPDFRLEPKLFNRVSVSIGVGEGHEVWDHYLPKHGMRSWWQTMVYNRDITIPGSEDHVLFKDAGDGVWKLGSQFDPIRQYGILTHGIFDFGGLAIIIVIGFVLQKAGFFQMARTFFRSIFQGVYTMSRAHDMVDGDETDDIMERVEEVLEDTELIQAINSKLGVRLSIGR
jgi:hypothetical protein